MTSIKKNFIYNILLGVSSVLFPLITAPYVSRVLEPDGVGLANFAVMYTGYFSMVACLGIPTYGIREIAKRRDSKGQLNDLFSELFTISVINTVAVSAIYVATVFFIPQLAEDWLLFLIAGCALYLSPFQIDWYFSGIECFGFITLRSIVVRAISIICLFLFVKDKQDLVIYVILGAVSNVGSNVWNYIALLRNGIRPRLTRKHLDERIKPLLVLFSSTVAISIYTVLDTLMLGFIKDYSQVGFYTYATHISKILLAVVTSLSAVATPRMSYYSQLADSDRIRELANKSLSVITFLAMPMSVGLACVAPFFVPLFYGEGFQGTIVPLMVMSFVITAIGLNNLTGTQILIGLGHDTLFLKSVLAGTLSNFFMNLILIPHLGAIGASIASVLAETLVLVIGLRYVHTHTPIRFHAAGSNLLKSAAGSLLFVPVILVLKNLLSGWLLVFVFVAVGLIVYLAFESMVKHSSVHIVLGILKSKFPKINLNQSIEQRL